MLMHINYDNDKLNIFYFFNILFTIIGKLFI